MFTGIVEELGTVVGREDIADAARLTVAGSVVLTDSALGDSISVNGCCLTVAELGDGTFTADVMRETLDRTSLGALQPGDPVNLERAVTLQTRLGGHLVSGHIDATGTVVRRTPSEHWEVVEIEAPPALLRYVVEKGSIAVDGTSLTVVDVTDSSFTISLIPETLRRTTLGQRLVGATVNLEADLLAKHVEKLLGTREDPR